MYSLTLKVFNLIVMSNLMHQFMLPKLYSFVALNILLEPAAVLDT